MTALLSTLTDNDLGTIIVVLGIACLFGAGYMAYLRNALGVALFIVVAIVCFLLAD